MCLSCLTTYFYLSKDRVSPRRWVSRSVLSPPHCVPCVGLLKSCVSDTFLVKNIVIIFHLTVSKNLQNSNLLKTKQMKFVTIQLAQIPCAVIATLYLLQPLCYFFSFPRSLYVKVHTVVADFLYFCNRCSRNVWGRWKRSRCRGRGCRSRARGRRR